MARYQLTVSYNDPNVGFQLQDAIAKVLSAAGEDGASPQSQPAPASAPPQAPAGPRPAAPPQQRSNGNPPAPRISNPDAPLSDNQRQFIFDLVGDLALDWQDLYSYMEGQWPGITEHDSPIDQLTKGTASSLITALKNGEVAAADAPF